MEDPLFTLKELTVAGQIGIKADNSYQNVRKSTGQHTDNRKSSRKPWK